MANVYMIVFEFEEYCAVTLKNIHPAATAASSNIYNFSICFNTFADNLKMYGNNIRNQAIRILSESDEEDVRILMEELFKTVKKWIAIFLSTYSPASV